MNFRKLFMLLVFAAIPATAGFAFTPQANSDKDTSTIPLSPGMIVPDDQGSGTLSIVPGQKDNSKIQYRNILYGSGDSRDRDKGSPRDSTNMYDRTAPDNDKGSRDPDDPMNKSFILPPGADRAERTQPDQDSSGISPQSKDQDPSSIPVEGGNPATRSNSSKLRYVADDTHSEIGNSQDFDLAPDRDEPEDTGTNL